MQFLQSLGRSRDKGRENGILDPYLLTPTEPESPPRPRIRLVGTSLRSELSRFQSLAAGTDGPAINWVAFVEFVSKQIQEKEAAQQAGQQRTLKSTRSVRAPRGNALLLGTKQFNSVRTRYVSSPGTSRDSSPDHGHDPAAHTCVQEHSTNDAGEPSSPSTIARQAAAEFSGARGQRRTRRQSPLATPNASSHEDLLRLVASGQQPQVLENAALHPFAAAFAQGVAALGSAQSTDVHRQAAGPHSWGHVVRPATAPLQSVQSSSPMLCIAPDVQSAEREQLQSQMHELIHLNSPQHYQDISPPSSGEPNRVSRVMGAALRGVARLLPHRESAGAAITEGGSSAQTDTAIQTAPNTTMSPVTDGVSDAMAKALTAAQKDAAYNQEQGSRVTAAAAKVSPARTPPRSRMAPLPPHSTSPSRSPGASMAIDTQVQPIDSRHGTGHTRSPQGARSATSQHQLVQPPSLPSPAAAAAQDEVTRPHSSTSSQCHAAAPVLHVQVPEGGEAIEDVPSSLEGVPSVASTAQSIRSQTVTVPPTPSTPGPPTMAAWHEAAQELPQPTPTTAEIAQDAPVCTTTTAEAAPLLRPTVPACPHAEVPPTPTPFALPAATPPAIAAAAPTTSTAGAGPASTDITTVSTSEAVTDVQQAEESTVVQAVQPLQQSQQSQHVADPHLTDCDDCSQHCVAVRSNRESLDEVPELAFTGRRRLLEVPSSPSVPHLSPAAVKPTPSPTAPPPTTSAHPALLPPGPPPAVTTPQPTVGWLPRTNTAFLNAASSIAASLASSGSAFQMLDQDLFRILSDAVPLPGSGTAPSQLPSSSHHNNMADGAMSNLHSSGSRVGASTQSDTGHPPSLLQLAQQILLVNEPAAASRTSSKAEAPAGGGKSEQQATPAARDAISKEAKEEVMLDATLGDLPTVFSITDSGETLEVQHPQSKPCTDLDAAAAAAMVKVDGAKVLPGVSTPATPEGSIEEQPMRTSQGRLWLPRSKAQAQKASDSSRQFNSMQLQMQPKGAAATRTISDGLWQPLGGMQGINWHARDGTDLQLAGTPSVGGAADNLLSTTTYTHVDQEQSYWSIAHSDITLIRRLGSGSYGEVWLAQYHFVDVAVKLIPWTWSTAVRTSSCTDSSVSHEEEAATERDLCVAELARFRQEVDFQRRLSLHPNIVPFIGACEPCVPHQSSPIQQLPGAGQAGHISPNVGDSPSPDQLAIVMGYCKLGDLYNMIRKARMVSTLLAKNRKAEAGSPSLAHAMLFYQSWERRLDVAAGAAAGLYHMHSKGVIHRDLTSYNILLDAGFSAKVSDFNLSRVVPRGTSILLANSGSLNSPLWQGPEMLRGDVLYDGKLLDVFSFGIILSEIITLWVPYTQGSEEEATALMSDMKSIWPLISKIAAGVRPYLPTCHSELQPPLPSWLSGDQAEEVFHRLVELTQSCWSQNPGNRPSMQHVAGELRTLVGMLRTARQQQQLAGSTSGGRHTRTQQREG